MTKSSLSVHRDLKWALRQAAQRAGERAPSVRGSDWRLATVTAVNADGTIVADGITARRMEAYRNAAVGDVAVLDQSSSGNWIAHGRLATAAALGPVPYTPTVTGGGSVTWSTRVGQYMRLDRLVFVSVRLVVNAAGSGSANVQIDMPSAVDGTLTDQHLTARFTENRVGYAIKFQGSSSTTLDRLRMQDQGTTNQVVNVTGADLTAGRIIGIEGFYFEA
ncbi:hypothetical protein [Streptomyces reticuli]|uniref:hypothetical protein n=1 Tax=Streptomyces reticuli TaxID=1926 RepID=UPI00073DBA85|nr:hypothetical protein [Streptomyces sp. SID7810]CUW31795.1 hypothetical protein TUE45_06544 [Streptomyces reticuli]